MTNFEFPTLQKQKELGSVWERAIQGIYVPRKGGAANDDLEEVRVQARKYVEKGKEGGEFPDTLKRGVWYSITGYNPMGENRDEDENRRANSRLLKVLQQNFPPSNSASPRRILSSYGTEEGAHWREDGFLVRVVEGAREGVDTTDGKEEEEKFLKIGRDFGQAALYRLEWVEKEKDGRREGTMVQNVKACFEEMRGVESELDVVRVI